jgi:hypothetical protein
MGAVTPETCRVTLQWINLCVLLHQSWIFLLTYNNLLSSEKTLLICILTYLLTPCSTVLLEKLTGSQLVKKFPEFYETRRFIIAFTSASHLSLSGVTLDPVRIPTSHFLKIHLNIILQSLPGSPKCTPSLRFSHQNPVYTSPLPLTCYMPRLSHFSLFYHPHDIWWVVQIIKLLVM